MTDLFETATRCSYRYSSARGLLTTEDLWSVPLERPLRRQADAGHVCLDDIARTLSKELQEQEEQSFVKPRRTDKASQLRAKLDVVKRIIEYKLLAVASKEQAAAKAQEKARLLEVVAKKDGAALEALTREELLAKLNSL